MAAVECAFSFEGQGPALFLIHGIGARKTAFCKLTEAMKDPDAQVREKAVAGLILLGIRK